MSFQSLNPELTAKVLLLANLQRNLIQNQNEKTKAEENTINTGQQQLMHPLLMPSLNVSSQKISAMLTALTPSSIVNPSIQITNPMPIYQSTTSSLTNGRTNIRSNGSSFGWGNRERKMEENWRMQNRNI